MKTRHITPEEVVRCLIYSDNKYKMNGLSLLFDDKNYDLLRRISYYVSFSIYGNVPINDIINRCPNDIDITKMPSVAYEHSIEEAIENLLSQQNHNQTNRHQEETPITKTDVRDNVQEILHELDLKINKAKPSGERYTKIRLHKAIANVFQQLEKAVNPQDLMGAVIVCCNHINSMYYKGCDNPLTVRRGSVFGSHCVIFKYSNRQHKLLEWIDNIPTLAEVFKILDSHSWGFSRDDSMAHRIKCVIERIYNESYTKDGTITSPTIALRKLWNQLNSNNCIDMKMTRYIENIFRDMASFGFTTKDLTNLIVFLNSCVFGKGEYDLPISFEDIKGELLGEYYHIFSLVNTEVDSTCDICTLFYLPKNPSRKGKQNNIQDTYKHDVADEHQMKPLIMLTDCKHQQYLSMKKDGQHESSTFISITSSDEFKNFSHDRTVIVVSSENQKLEDSMLADILYNQKYVYIANGELLPQAFSEDADYLFFDCATKTLLYYNAYCKEEGH